MGWDQDSQVMDGLTEHRAYNTAERHSQKLVRKHIQKYSDKTIGARKNGGHPLSVFSRSFMPSIPLALTLPLFSLTAQAEGKWVQAEGQWQYQMEGQIQKGWKEISGSWYYFDPLTGKMQDGWILADGKWYFLKTDTANWGKMAQGWTWVDGYCYFLKDNGTMATEEKTPDGYSISANGQWVQDGKPVHEEGKGVSSRCATQIEKEIKTGAAEGQQINANGEAQNTVIKGIAGSGGSGGSGGGGKADNLEFVLTPRIKSDCMEIDFVLKFKNLRKSAAFGIFIETETGVMDADAWESNINDTFPVIIDRIDSVSTHSLNTDKDLQITVDCTQMNPEVNNDYSCVKLLESKSGKNIAGFSVYNEITNAEVRGRMTVRTIDRKYVCTVKEIKNA